MSNLWFLGFSADGGNAWASEAIGGDSDLILEASPSQIQVGAETRLTVKTTDLGSLGKTVTLTISDASVATTTTLTGTLEKDAYGNAAVTFLVTGLVEGETVISASVNG